MKILLTGFEPFGKVAVNPSQKVVEALAARGNPALIPVVLPVEYNEAGPQLYKLIAMHQPLAVLMLGVAQGRDSICLERIALNINDASLADNSGTVQQGGYILEEGPLAYESSLPLTTMLKTLRQHNIPARISNHAGTYLCNNIFYLARHALGPRDTPCGFVHLPAIGDEKPNLPFDIILAAVDICLDVLVHSLQTKAPMADTD